MAVTIAHKAANAAAQNSYTVLSAIHAWMLTLPGVFTIHGSANLTGAGGWFTFSMVGHPWQVCLCAVTTTATVIAAGNSQTIRTYDINCAFAPNGGWAPGDTPLGTCFSLSSGGGTYWSKFRGATGSNWSGTLSAILMSFWYDVTTGWFAFLCDDGGNNSWDTGLSVVPLVSRFPAQDPQPFVVMAGTPGISGGGSYWAGQNFSPHTYSHLMLPGAYSQVGGLSTDTARKFDAATQPNPLTGLYDVEALSVLSVTAGMGHSRGYTRHLMQVSSALGLRTRFGVGADAMIVVGSGLALPWDQNIVP